MDDGEAPATYTLIRDLPAAERLRDYGAAALSSTELLAILLRVGGANESALAQAQRLLKRFNGLPGIWRSSFAELCNEKGLGEAKASQLKAALELGMRLASAAPDARPVVRSPEDIADMVLAEMSLLEQEHIRVVLLDTRNQIIGMPTVYIGSVHTTHVRIGDLLSEAVRAKAAAIVVVHNHPSGDPTPSAADAQTTRQLYDAAKLMGIDLHDHMVVGGGRYVSMRALGLGMPKDGT